MSAAAKWAGFPVLAFDTESTGVDPLNERIVQAALVELHPGQRPVTATYLVDPGIDIPVEASEIHGITREHAAANATHTPEQMLFEISGRIARWLGQGMPVVAFNAAYDMTLLEAENMRRGQPTLLDRLGMGKVTPIVDIFVLDKFADPYRKGGRKLAQVCEHYGVVHAGEHDATADAIAAARIFPRLMAKHIRKFPGMTLPALHAEQVKWRRQQADGLREYFDKKGIEHDGVDPGWPTYLGLQRHYSGQTVPA
ncbi:exonuclease domain-containing protein [Pimelobacter simplex]|uniref:exonuclease domain-containing protein n=1 Tax=Nocardioides simplex TaxID=2045 RepID=UPI00214FDDBA|nr:exonuclease domain-containing protein [Pimelobacter simplex]UUW88436.1 exonuclease domain-containing protein [Pimelobacter simplex]UUW97940.1 exonuclease domain-containing protein [Pimelobacter simplex]